MRVFSLTGWCRQIPTRLLRPRGTQDTAINIKLTVYGAITLYCSSFQMIQLHLISHVAVLQPRYCLNKERFGLFPVRSPLLRESLFVFFSSSYLDVSVHWVGSTMGFPTSSGRGLPIRKSSDQRLFASPRSLSQLITSFIAFKSLGILHAPLNNFLLVHLIKMSSVFSSNMSKNIYSLSRKWWRITDSNR